MYVYHPFLSVRIPFSKSQFSYFYLLHSLSKCMNKCWQGERLDIVPSDELFCL